MARKTDNPPCYKCENRRPGCHAECDAYKAWKSEQQREAEEISRNRKDQTFDPRLSIRSVSVDNRIKEKARK